MSLTAYDCWTLLNWLLGWEVYSAEGNWSEKITRTSLRFSPVNNCRLHSFPTLTPFRFMCLRWWDVKRIAMRRQLVTSQLGGGCFVMPPQTAARSVTLCGRHSSTTCHYTTWRAQLRTFTPVPLVEISLGGCLWFVDDTRAHHPNRHRIVSIYLSLPPFDLINMHYFCYWLLLLIVLGRTLVRLCKLLDIHLV